MYQRGEATQAIDVVIQVLRELGVPFPKNRHLWKITAVRNLIRLKKIAVAKTSEEILNLPPAGQRTLHIIDFIRHLNFFAISVGDRFCHALGVSFGVFITFEQGATPLTPRLLVQLGSVLLSPMGMHEEAFRYATVGTEMAARTPTSVDSVCIYRFLSPSCCSSFWKSSRSANSSSVRSSP